MKLVEIDILPELFVPSVFLKIYTLEIEQCCVQGYCKSTGKAIAGKKRQKGCYVYYNGKLSCFFQGFWRFLLRRIDRERQMRQRVFCGRMTSSIYPREAATKGDANFSLYSFTLVSTSEQIR